MQIIGLTKAVGFTVLTFTLSATPVWSQTNQNSFKETPILYSQSQFDRDLALVYLNRGIDYAGQQKWDLAVADYTQAITLNPNYAAGYILRGAVYYEQRKWDLAVADYTQAIKLDPNSSEAYSLRGIVYYGLGDINKVRQDFQRAAQLFLTQGNTTEYKRLIRILNSL